MSEEINNLKGIFANVNDDMLLRDCGNLYAENKKLQQENQQLKEDIKNIIKILRKNCDDLEATEEEFDSLYRWQNE